MGKASSDVAQFFAATGYPAGGTDGVRAVTIDCIEAILTVYAVLLAAPG